MAPLNALSVLDRPVGDLLLKGVKIDTAMQTLRDRTGANIVVQWEDLGCIGTKIDRQTTVNISLFDASLHTALQTMLRSVDDELDFGITDGGTIVITARGHAPRTLFIHDIRDMAPQLQMLPPAAAGIAGGIVPVNLFPMSTVSAEQEDLVANVGSSLSTPMRRGWDECVLAGRWLVIQTPENHRQLRQILHQMRAIDKAKRKESP